MRVLNISGGISPNGADQTLERLDHYFAGWNVECGILDRPDPTFRKKAEARSMSTIFYGPSVTDRFENISLLPGPGYYTAIKHALTNRDKYDLVHVYGGPLLHGPVGKIHGALSNQPLVSRFNGYVPIPESRTKRELVERIQRWMLASDAVVFNSHTQKTDLLDTFDVSDGPHIYVIPPGVKQSAFTPENTESNLRGRLGIPTDAHVIGSCLTPRPVKRLDRSFELLEKLNSSGDTHFVIVGDSSHVSQYKAQARERDIENKVHWVGQVPQEALSKWYTLFDVTVLTSEWESFGMSISESYLCGTPCVAFDVGGLSDQIIDQETGYLVTPYDLSEFADAVRTLLQDTSLVADFATRGQEYVVNEFTLEAAGNKYQSLLQDIV